MRTTSCFALVFAISTCVTAAGQGGTPFASSQDFSTTVLKAFRQGQDNDFNCASIALVKVSIAQFGPQVLDAGGHEGIFSSDETTASGDHHIVLHDGSKVDLTAAEIATAEQKSGFTVPVNSKNPGDPALKKRANLLYAVMAKKAIDLHASNPRFSEADTFDNAIKLLQGGRNFEELAPLLGLVANEIGDHKNLPAQDNVAYVYTNNWHAVFSTEDRYDEYGDSQTVDSFNGYHTPAFGWFRSKENWAFTVSFPTAAS